MLSILFASIMNLLYNGSNYPAWVSELGRTENQEWPHWCIFIAVALIGVSVLWIPGVAICRLLGIKIVEDSEPAYFPSAELRDVNGIVPHEPTQFEKQVFFFKDEGGEGMCFPTFISAPEEVLQEED